MSLEIPSYVELSFKLFSWIVYIPYFLFICYQNSFQDDNVMEAIKAQLYDVFCTARAQEHTHSQHPADHRTLVVLRDIADEIDQHLFFTLDCCSKNPGGNMPFLDVAMWMVNKKLLQTFYRNLRPQTGS